MVRIQHEINIENLVRFLCARNCDITWRYVFYASDADIAAEVAWAAQRPKSGARRLEPGTAPTPRSALTPTEEEPGVLAWVLLRLRPKPAQAEYVQRRYVFAYVS